MARQIAVAVVAVAEAVGGDAPRRRAWALPQALRQRSLQHKCNSICWRALQCRNIGVDTVMFL